MNYSSKLEMKETYRDSVTGFEGYLNGVTFFENGCVRGCLERTDDKGKPEEVWFDEQRLVLNSQVSVGGPRDHSPRRSDGKA